MTDQSAVITHHEAGHLVAALMTVASQLDDQAVVTVRLFRGGGTGSGIIATPEDPRWAAFVFYAGPWAEARVQWGKPVHALDDIDDATPFRDLLARAFDSAPDLGGLSDRAMYGAHVNADPSIPGSESHWLGELERGWPVIEALADALRDRLDRAGPQVDAYAAELGPGGDSRSATMTNGEVVELVRPLLEQCGMWRYLS